MTPCPPFREPQRTTLLRTTAIALLAGAIAAGLSRSLARWPLVTLLAVWPSLGGHFVELWFLNWLRPRLPVAPRLRAAARIAVWFAGGTVLAIGMGLTAKALGLRPGRAWWLGGLAFIGIELLVHLVLQSRHRPSFYNGRG